MDPCDTLVGLRERNLKPQPQAGTSCTENRAVTTGRACLQPARGTVERGPQPCFPALQATQEQPGPRCLKHRSYWERVLGRVLDSALASHPDLGLEP